MSSAVFAPGQIKCVTNSGNRTNQTFAYEKCRSSHPVHEPLLTILAQESPKPSGIQEPSEVVKKFLTAFRQGDHEKFSSQLHPDVIWIQPADNRIAGVKKSKTELLQIGAKIAEVSAGTIAILYVPKIKNPTL